MPKFLINDIYPEVYWNLPNIDESQDSYELWWSSAERSGANTAEFLEIDLGRRRVINYLSFDVTKKPVDITVEYDSWSFSDPALGQRWIPVTPLREFPGMDGTKFDSAVIYSEGANINPWEHAQFFFADAEGNAVVAQRLRITFNRRVAEFPFADGSNPAWSIDVQNLRTARYVTGLTEARGILIENSDYNYAIDLTENGTQAVSAEVWQNFLMPNGYIRGEQGGFIPPKRDDVITQMVPSILGLGFMVEALQEEGDFAVVKPQTYAWSLHRVTNGEDTLLKFGSISKKLVYPFGWIDVFFDNPVVTSASDQYQLRVRSEDLTTSSKVYAKTNNPLKILPDEDTTNIDAYLAIQGSNPIQQKDSAIVFRVWADIGEAGKDVFGNEYREGVRRDRAENVNDSTIHTNWISGPNPDPTAVECLYFDVRTLNEATGKFDSSVVDSLRIDPITPGIFMTMYYANENVQGVAPITVDYPNGWEGVRWVPIVPPGAPYKVDRDQIFDLPHPVRASYICLEFTSLLPLPYRLNEFPELPPIRYKAFPESVKQRVNAVRPAQDDLYVQDTESVSVDLLSLFRVSDEFNYRQYNDIDVNFITNNAWLTAENIAQGRTSTDSFNAPVDPRTLAQIYFMGTQMYYSALPTKTNTDNVLGQFIASSYINKDYAQTEIPPGGTTSTQLVSNVNDRNTTAYATTPEVVNPYWFPNIERHAYSVMTGKFRNHKAYFAGIAEVEFLRKDFTLERDDTVIHDVLAESALIGSPLVEFNTWQPESPSTIPTSTVCYVIYSVGDIEYEEAVQFEADGATNRSFEPVLMSAGGERAINVSLYTGPSKTGTKYILGVDFDLLYDEQLSANYIQRNTLHYRLVSTNIKTYSDSGVVVGEGKISYTDLSAAVDSGTVTGATVIMDGKIYTTGGVRNITKTGSSSTGESIKSTKITS